MTCLDAFIFDPLKRGDPEADRARDSPRVSIDAKASMRRKGKHQVVSLEETV